ncbi:MULTISPECIES: nuclear transport factor 2 family protein [unclassified Streptomyces]|uniref:nuclear transport factor 2 family protein n=1 Tax=unclassified Streptomyces TaxID=2593676 RepID=UPI000360BCFA|nr:MULTISPECIES: nuclear transport factor 2 family protein [unclassified Streptomyces]MYQ81782.1 nuclear transport factor 2 family protein [Streptomyces sp. SID4923]NEC06308.1 nuclear transport factor 2 family protein [Streptomyces sp. SID7909]OKI91912.1 ketosteroid isomerase [Streptomyces sp. CB01249]
MTTNPELLPVDAEAAVRLVRRFYDLVDSGDADGVAALFAPDALYRRPGYPPMVGPAGLLGFYGRDRTIRAGNHTLTNVLADGAFVGVFGEFHGVLHSGDPVDLRFADSFTVRPDDLFADRDTYFFAPLV